MRRIDLFPEFKEKDNSICSLKEKTQVGISLSGRKRKANVHNTEHSGSKKIKRKRGRPKKIIDPKSKFYFLYPRIKH